MEEDKTDAGTEVQTGTDRNGAETDRGGSGEWEVDAAGRRWCMNRNWPATNPTHRSITYQEGTTMAYRARPSG